METFKSDCNKLAIICLSRLSIVTSIKIFRNRTVIYQRLIYTSKLIFKCFSLSATARFLLEITTIWEESQLEIRRNRRRSGFVRYQGFSFQLVHSTWKRVNRLLRLFTLTLEGCWRYITPACQFQ